jgi:hypothetical protein
MRAGPGFKRFPSRFSFELVAPGYALKTQLSLEFSSEKTELVAD